MNNHLATQWAMGLMGIEDYKMGKEVSIVKVLESAEDGDRIVSEGEDVVFGDIKEGVEGGKFGT